jgi:hypothetical protein
MIVTVLYILVSMLSKVNGLFEDDGPHGMHNGYPF